MGLGGKTFRNLHAIETARMLNKTHPKCIWALALKLWPGTPLYKAEKRGEFDALDYRGMLLEERLLLENLTVKDCFYMDTTVLGKYTIQGQLPEGKEAILGRSINCWDERKERARMKRWIGLLLTVVLLLAGCGRADDFAVVMATTGKEEPFAVTGEVTREAAKRMREDQLEEWLEPMGWKAAWYLTTEAMG